MVDLSSCEQCLLPPADEDDLTDVMLAVVELTARWRDLGISLGIRPSVLDTVLSTFPRNPRWCLAEMLKEWLRRDYNVSTTLQPWFCSKFTV